MAKLNRLPYGFQKLDETGPDQQQEGYIVIKTLNKYVILIRHVKVLLILNLIC